MSMPCVCRTIIDKIVGSNSKHNVKFIASCHPTLNILPEQSWFGQTQTVCSLALLLNKDIIISLLVMASFYDYSTLLYTA